MFMKKSEKEALEKMTIPPRWLRAEDFKNLARMLESGDSAFFQSFKEKD